MKSKFVLCLIINFLVLTVAQANEYQLEAGLYTVKFNSSQDLVILPPLPYEESGSHASGWDINIQDNLSHTIASITIVEEDQISPVSNEIVAYLLDNNMEKLTGLKEKKSVKLNGAEGLISGGYSEQFGMNVKIAIAPFSQFYDPFFKKNSTNTIIVLMGYDLPVYDEILNSLNITTSEQVYSAASTASTASSASMASTASADYSSVANPASGPTIDSEWWLNQGRSLFNQGKYEEAIVAFDAAIRLNPDLVEAWQAKFASYGIIGMHNESINALNMATKIDPDNAEIWNFKGLYCMLIARFDDSIEAFDQAIRIEPQNAEFWYQRGDALLFLHKFNESIESLDRAIELDPSGSDYLDDRCLAFYGLARYNESLQCYSRSIEINNSSVDAWFGKGLVLEALGRDLESQSAYANAGELGLSDAQEAANRCEALYISGKYNETIDACDRALNQSQDFSETFWLIKGMALRMNHRESEAVSAINISISKFWSQMVNDLSMEGS